MKQPYNTTIYNTALYLRLSRDDELQGESGSIQTQRMMLRQYAAEHGLTVVDEYIDDGWSGTNFERPSFQRMIDDIEDGKINCVVTKDLSRLGRNYILTGQYTEIYFPSKGVRYLSLIHICAFRHLSLHSSYRWLFARKYFPQTLHRRKQSPQSFSLFR